MSTSGSSGGDVTAMADTIHDGIRTSPSRTSPRRRGAGRGRRRRTRAHAHGRLPSRARGPSSSAATPTSASPRPRCPRRCCPPRSARTRALRLLLQDETIDAETALLDWGLVTELAVDPAARAAEVAGFWLDNATAAFGQAARLIRAGARRTFADNLADEARTIGAAFDTPEAKARVAAFAQASTSRTPKEKA
ncbi:MAG: enoyl-CoA hydratase/isomerase family protein [Microbacterium sp.]